MENTCSDRPPEGQQPASFDQLARVLAIMRSREEQALGFRWESATCAGNSAFLRYRESNGNVRLCSGTVGLNTASNLVIKRKTGGSNEMWVVKLGEQKLCTRGVEKPDTTLTLDGVFPEASFIAQIEQELRAKVRDEQLAPILVDIFKDVREKVGGKI